MCSIAVGLVGDICRALNEGVIPYTDEFMNHLLEDLQVNLYKYFICIINDYFKNVSLCIKIK